MRFSLLHAFLFLTVSSLGAEPPAPRFRPIEIDSKVNIGYGVAVADVDGDKLPDILLADKKQFAWYRNPGAERVADPTMWTRHILAENLTEKDNVCLAAQDIDGDGKCEIAVGAEWNPGDTVKSGAVFYLIPPADRTQRWEPVKLHAEPTTHRMRWAKVSPPRKPGAAAERMTPGPRDWALVVVPLHGRGNRNGEGAGVRILRYLPPASLNDAQGEWKTELVDDSLHMTHNLFVLDAQKGLLLAGREGLIHVFPELQPGGETQWRRNRWIGEGTPVATPGIGELRFGEIAKDENVLATVEPMHGNQLVAYLDFQAAADGAMQPKIRRVLSDQLTDGHALACGNLLGTGGDQIVVGWRGNAQKPRPVGIKLFTPLDVKGEKWREDFIDDNTMACEDLTLADLNGDGRLDVVASGRSTHNLKLYLNETTR